MTATANLPAWVINLVAGLAEYEEMHPTLYAQFAGNPNWQKAECPGALLEKVPADVLAFVAGWRAARRFCDEHPDADAQQAEDAGCPHGYAVGERCGVCGSVSA